MQLSAHSFLYHAGLKKPSFIRRHITRALAETFWKVGLTRCPLIICHGFKKREIPRREFHERRIEYAISHLLLRKANSTQNIFTLNRRSTA